MTRTTNNQNGEGAAKAASTLSQIAERIDAELDAMKDAEKAANETALARALRIGELLRQARSTFPPHRGTGGWSAWLTKRFPTLPSSTARRWMMLADPNNRSCTITCSSINEALRKIHSPASAPKTRKRKKNAGSLLHGLHAKKRDNDTDLTQTRIKVQRLVQVLEAADLPEQGVGNADDETLADIHQELTIASGWVDASLAVIVNHMGEQTIRERIRKLREDTNGRTPHEADTAARLADRLERKLGLALTA